MARRRYCFCPCDASTRTLARVLSACPHCPSASVSPFFSVSTPSSVSAFLNSSKNAAFASISASLSFAQALVSLRHALRSAVDHLAIRPRSRAAVRCSGRSLQRPAPSPCRPAERTGPPRIAPPPPSSCPTPDSTRPAPRRCSAVTSFLARSMTAAASAFPVLALGQELHQPHVGTGSPLASFTASRNFSSAFAGSLAAASTRAIQTIRRLRAFAGSELQLSKGPRAGARRGLYRSDTHIASNR